MLNRVRIILLLCFVFLFVGCSHPTKTSIIKKTPLSFEAESQFQTVDTYEIRRLSNGTYIYRDRQYPGLD